MATKAHVTAHEQFATLHADTRDRLIDLAFRWAEGELSAATFAEEMDALLLDAHTAAVVIGRTHAGDDAPEDEDDRRFAGYVVEAEHGYLQGFAEQMQSGAYTDEAGVRDAERVAARAAWYADRTAGSANEAWGLTLPEETSLWWKLGAEDGRNCSDCPELEEASPYTPASIPTYPGKNDTLCGRNCRCAVQTEGGLVGFTVPD